MKEARLALVTGANRGIGLQVVKELAQRGLRVILACRDVASGEKVRATIESPNVFVHALDVSDQASIDAMAAWAVERFGGIDILVNNAGVLLDGETQGTDSVFTTRRDILEHTMATNVWGPLFLSQAFVPGMKKRRFGRVVNVSSGMGQLSDMSGGSPAYRMSKTALNALTRMVHSESSGHNVLVNAVCPGWVRTDMGGRSASRSVEKGAETIVWAATLPDDGPSGGFFRDKKPIPW